MNPNILIIHISKHKNSMHLRRKLILSSVLFENPVIRHAQNNRSYNSLVGPKNFDAFMLMETKKEHAFLLKSNILSCSIYAANNVIRRYWECNRLDYSFKMLDEIPETNIVTWNLMILGCNKNFLFEDSWRVFCRMHALGIDADEFTYGSVLSACVAWENPVLGESVYGFLVKNGFFASGYVRAGMIDLFVRCSRVEDALKVLYDVPCENVVCWNSLVSGAVKIGDHCVALGVFKQMCRNKSLVSNAYTFSSVLTACAAVNDELELGKSVHGRVIKCGAETDIFVGTALLDFYAKRGAICDAARQFRLMPERNVVTWTAVISGFVQRGDSASAIMILNNLKQAGEEINSFTVSTVLAACGSSDMFGEASQIHSWVVKIGLSLDPVVKSSLLSTYSKLGAVTLAETVFTETVDTNDEDVWTNMICALAQNGCYEKAINLFHKMLKQGFLPNQFSASSILSITEQLTLGRQVHGYAIKAGLMSDVSVGSSILTMYSKCDSLDESLKAFEQLERKDDVAWTSMIAGFVEHGYADKGLQLFRDAVLCNSINDAVILTAALNACSATCSSSKTGREIHGFVLRRRFCEQVTIHGALVNMYSKCGNLNYARYVFHTMPMKDHVSWSSIVSGFAQRGRVEEALELFHDMLLSDSKTDAYTISSLLGAVTASGVGTQLHGHVVKVGLESESSVGSSLVMMYSKDGNIDGCDKAFQGIRNPDLASWTSIVASYAHHGKGSEALKLFNLMINAGIKPDSVTFLGVLSACSHSGLVEEGYFHLNSMINDYGIEPGYKHYACMVDLLGRAGRLTEAERFIRDMPLKLDDAALVWETLLAACKIHGDRELAKLASEKIMELQTCRAGAYVSLSNMFADAGDWDRVVEIRDSMRGIGAKQKEPAWSNFL